MSLLSPPAVSTLTDPSTLVHALPHVQVDSVVGPQYAALLSATSRQCTHAAQRALDVQDEYCAAERAEYAPLVVGL